MTIATTPASPPVLVQTVNGWIMIQQKLDASYSFNRSWADFQVNNNRKQFEARTLLNSEASIGRKLLNAIERTVS